jgi:hypothetical protein
MATSTGIKLGSAILFFSVGVLGTSIAVADCIGNACEFVRIEEAGGCVYLTNTHSTTTVRVMRPKLVGGALQDVQPNSRMMVIESNGRCSVPFSNLNYTANFKSPPPTESEASLDVPCSISRSNRSLS